MELSHDSGPGKCLIVFDEGQFGPIRTRREALIVTGSLESNLKSLKAKTQRPQTCRGGPHSASVHGPDAGPPIGALLSCEGLEAHSTM